jgi:DNA-binding XRE family transcriptional regulator
MNTLSERLKQVMRDHRLNKAKLAKLAGVTSPAVIHWGKSGRMSNTSAELICLRLGVDKQWLVHGKPEQVNAAQTNPTRAMAPMLGRLNPADIELIADTVIKKISGLFNPDQTTKDI